MHGRGSAESGGRSPRPAAARVTTWRVVVPGLPQWSWGQRERALVLFGSWLTGMWAAAFTWGTPTGLMLLAFAYATHVVSVADALEQVAFPPLGRWAPWLTSSGVMAAVVYGPGLGLVAWLAWPGVRAGELAEGYLVNCWAYRAAAPSQGDWVWFRPADWGEPRLGRVLAGAGQEVHWSANRLRVDGKRVLAAVPFRSRQAPAELRYRVPEGHVLISPERHGRPTGNIAIVGQGRVMGRAWAQFYPVLDRRLLD